jgi:hypothetical protein
MVKERSDVEATDARARLDELETTLGRLKEYL